MVALLALHQRQRLREDEFEMMELEEEDQREEKSEGFIDDEIENDDKEDDIESESDNLVLEDSVVNNAGEGEGSTKEGLKRNGIKAPTLTVKEKKELASYAHGLGKKLKSQLIGKSGFTDNVATSFIETLEANELLKIKIHRTCPGELEDVVRRLEEATAPKLVSVPLSRGEPRRFSGHGRRGSSRV
ncbi:CRS1/YHBY DOMAIN CONTAINING PROTEIN EXPRESSED [Salix purpurea]|uniref:CRS1/YHBY DOMAIN CONTAINING PROTEIN EXPRESSED n=1 Tax=Salix purpurea TaxID=77065 RepID=A0A9Q0PQX2_SALPP|nr:CRS1/YHBY DOMAIN CONTAINING PROTEIN EXPRESSED [Salix purpurea]